MTERFELLEQLGRGAMGTVWKVRDSATREFVALKLLNPHLVEDEDSLRRFEREAEIASRLDSPRIVRVHGFGRREGQPYLAMDFVEGETLRTRLQRRGPLPWPEAKPLLRDVAEALEVAHRAGVVHRDVKPANVMLDGDGRALVTDFGIARAMDQTALTGSSTVLGTPLYMAPEAEVTALSDLYALGCIAYEMLAGAPPFDGATHQQIWLRHLTDTPDLHTLPEEARALIAWLLQKDPAHRAQSAEQVLRVLDGTMRTPLVGVNSHRSRSRQWRRGVVAAGIGITALTGTLLVLLLDRGEGVPAEAKSNLAASGNTAAGQVTGTADSGGRPSTASGTPPEISGSVTPLGSPSPAGTPAATHTAAVPSGGAPSPTSTSTRPATAASSPTALPTATPSPTATPTPTPSPTTKPSPTPPAASGLVASGFAFFVAFDHDEQVYDQSIHCDRSRPASQFRPGPGEGLCLDWTLTGAQEGRLYTIKREIRHNGILNEEFTFQSAAWNGAHFNSTPQGSAPGTYVWTWLMDGVAIGSGTVTVP